ncbi:MAG: SpoIIE family protein phosphatase [Eubacteriales bacterium]|nr:SpoIIE family protein phosphatase [Eubacteriales bacterium]
MKQEQKKKQPEMLSGLCQRILDSVSASVSQERFFAENGKVMDSVLCIGLLIFILIILSGICIELFSENEYLFRGDSYSFNSLVGVLCALTATAAIGWKGKNRIRPWFRYLAVFAASIAILVLSSYLMIGMIPLVLFPIFLSSFYFDGLHTAVSSVLVSLSRAAGLHIYYNRYIMKDFSYLGDVIKEAKAKTVADIIDLILIFLSGVFCMILSIRIRKIMEQKLRKEQEKAIMERDMATAGKIQDRMLVREFPLREEYEISAFMTPARQVGGDFYDFIELSEDRVALVIADVSGKGLQASLYMSQVKAMIKVYAELENSVDKILEKTNSYLTSGPPNTRLFVTVWVGILDLRTGMLSYSNAGHNPPCISLNGKPYEFMESQVNFVVGGKRLIRYAENQIKLKPGDRIFLYTDGVTEAKNEDGSFYSDQSLLACLNGRTEAGPDAVIGMLKESLHAFTQNTEQYDDITMLSFLFKAYAMEAAKSGKSFPADREHFREAMQYIRSESEKIGCSEKILKDIEIACSELVANICSYAYDGGEGDLEILVEECGREVKISLTDHGMPFNPLLNDTPDTTVVLSERKAGGFGIFIAKKLMNDVLYKYENNSNVLVLIKQFK